MRYMGGRLPSAHFLIPFPFPFALSFSRSSLSGNGNLQVADERTSVDIGLAHMYKYPYIISTIVSRAFGRIAAQFVSFKAYQRDPRSWNGILGVRQPRECGLVSVPPHCSGPEAQNSTSTQRVKCASIFKGSTKRKGRQTYTLRESGASHMSSGLPLRPIPILHCLVDGHPRSDSQLDHVGHASCGTLLLRQQESSHIAITKSDRIETVRRLSLSLLPL
jgi:hypothetical protein